MENEQITLAPMAGAGMGKKLADYLLAQPTFIEDMGQVILRAIRAKTRHWDREAKDFVIEDDCKVQLQAFALTVAHMEGEPVKRIIHQHLGAGGKLDLGSALQESPELAQAVEKELQKAKWRTSGHQAHKRPAKAAKEQPAELVEDAEGAKP